MIMKYLYRIYTYCIAFPILLAVTLLTALTTSVGCTFGKASFWGYWPACVWSRMICFLLGIRVRVTGREHLQQNTSYVFVANHQGAFDIFLIYGYLGRNFKWMMKQSLRKIPFVGRACADAGHIFVNRGNPKGMADTLLQAELVLRHGTSMVVFPEGARSMTGEMGSFKRGAFQLATELQLPIVPMTINGSFRILPRGTRCITPHPLTLTIHAPIAPPATAEEAYQVIHAHLHL
jgi:1-acyl-sn-glycerol-3-phosphate acyltransferase